MGLESRQLRHEEPRFSFLGQWHANLIYINRQKSLLFVNDRTLLNFIILGLDRAQIKELPEHFRLWLSCVLSDEGIPEDIKEKILSEYAELVFAKSSNRSVLGSANELAFHYKHAIHEAGGVHSWQVAEIIREMNRMPLQAIETKFPIDELARLYGFAANKRIERSRL